MNIPDNISLTANGEELVDHLLDTRKRELELIANLSDEQMIGERIKIVEPPIWELGHVGWFQDRWILQGLDKQEPVSVDADNLYDSFSIRNEERWDLIFPSLAETKDYINEVFQRIIKRLHGKDPSELETYYYRLLLNHEDMHSETMHHVMQTFGYEAPTLDLEPVPSNVLEIDPIYELHDVSIPGGTYMLGAVEKPGMRFVFDNEKWAHPVQVAAYKIASTPVTFGEYRKFVEEDGYKNTDLWTKEGKVWLKESGQQQPVYWQKDSGDDWTWRWFDKWNPINEFHPMIHVNWYEANAYAKWAGRRLPTEAEWDLAASGSRAKEGDGFEESKRWYPWGDQEPSPEMANLDSRNMGIVDVRAFPAGDSAFGARQMIGNVWEWTANTFDAFPGYVIDPYATYSEPSFGEQKVLRGGCWATRWRVTRNTFRNFYTPDRNNIFAGFRTVKN
ncbi:MAG: SUMF1/EgtB/PvdO family nonheme iron enzyme [Chloroflexota bacterium]